MNRFSDPKAEDVYLDGFSTRLPNAVARKAHVRLHLLLAARDLQDVAVMGVIGRWPKAGGAYAIHVENRWYIVFRWEDLVGAFDIKLERLKGIKREA